MRGKWKRIKRVSVALFLAATITFGVVGDTTKVFAQTEPMFDQGFFSGNDIFFYDPTYQAVCGNASIVGANTREKIWNFLIANDLSPEQAAGLMGNMKKESQFSPVKWQRPSEPIDNVEVSNAWGLVQWDFGRRWSPPDGGIIGEIKKNYPELDKYITPEFGTEWISEPREDFPEEDFDKFLFVELDFLIQESMSRDLRGSGNDKFDGSADKEWARMKEQTTVRNATLFWEWNFERSNDPNVPGALEGRVNDAQEIFDEFKDNLSAAGSGTAGCTGAEGIQELATAYAWPEYHPADYLPTKPAYVEAVQKAQDEGRYVGGRAHPGIDCGGFVTLLVTNSGYDPEYNHGGKGGNTATQLAWLRDEKNGWRRVGQGGDIKSTDLKPGDVAIYNSGDNGHTFIFLGEDMVQQYDFGLNAEPGIASASISSWRAPMAGRETVLDPQFEWFSKE